MDYRTITTLKDFELKEILLTVDGKGKPVKEMALQELLERQYNKGHNEGYSEASGADSSLGMMG